MTTGGGSGRQWSHKSAICTIQNKISEGYTNPCVLCYQTGIYVLIYQIQQYMWRTYCGNLPPHKNTPSPGSCFEPALSTVIDIIFNMLPTQAAFCQKDAILRAALRCCLVWYLHTSMHTWYNTQHKQNLSFVLHMVHTALLQLYWFSQLTFSICGHSSSYNVVASSSRAWLSKTFWPLNMRPLCCLKTFSASYPVMWHHTSEEWISSATPLWKPEDLQIHH